MPDVPIQPVQSREVVEALNLMGQALSLLDDNQVPGEIGAHLDLAICLLRDHLGMTLRTV